MSPVVDVDRDGDGETRGEDEEEEEEDDFFDAGEGAVISPDRLSLRAGEQPKWQQRGHRRRHCWSHNAQRHRYHPT